MLLLAGAIAASATAASGADPGVTSTRILLGSTSSGSAAARGADAYFRYVNARGGVNGRRIEYRVADDGGDPALALEETQRLVEQDGVFALVNAEGTAQNLATRDYLNAQKVPQLFVASGATTFGRDHAAFPWTIGFQVSSAAEGWIYGSYLARARPGAKVAVLYQDDDAGKDLTAGLKRGLARSQARIVATEPAEPGATDVRAQLARLKASGANVLALFADAEVRPGWPLVVGSSAAPVEGSISTAFLKDPTAASWRGDAAMRLYRTLMARYAKGANAKDLDHVYGMAVAYETVRVLKAAGTRPTRRAVLALTARLNDASNPFLLPGISVRTSATDRFPIEQAQLQRWLKGRWTPIGGLWSTTASS